MKYLIIAIVLGSIGYYVFFYEKKEEATTFNPIKTEDQKIRDEIGAGGVSYQGAMIETYHKYKGAVQSAHDVVNSIESKQYSLD